MADSRCAKRLASLPGLSGTALGELWRQLFQKEPPPQIRKDLQVRIVAYRLQEHEFGGLSEASCRRLRELARTFEADPEAVVSTRPLVKPGTRLVREWKEQVYVVEVEAQGYEYKGGRYDSLSEIARLITGTRWSGPLFFGLKRNPSEPQESL
jgi:Protein of unknown function (DUF2924)